MTETPSATAAAREPLAVLQSMYAAEARYLAAGGPDAVGFDILAPFFAPDVVLHQAAGLPYGGTWHGHDGMARFFRAMSRTWESFRMAGQEILATGETLVVLHRIEARSRATGREIAFPILQTVAVRGGRISEVRPFYWDTAAIAETCGWAAARVN
ncbi:nuclear transport factor 2 family protein [Streptomyces sp. NBC_01411]|uniref:nuclear transport factor 2 family protein n=1 Tax=Streptomyces sp. NBC_01411 TaxID=2903857 RepID=UPI003249239E